MTTADTPPENQSNDEARPAAFPGLSDSRHMLAIAMTAPRLARRHLGLLNATVTHTHWELGDVVSDAILSDDITDAEATDLNRADLIITGHDDAGHTVHVVAEISVTIETTDVTRSDRRATILRKATGQTVRAVAIGNEAAPDAVAWAGSQQVTIMTIATPANYD